MTNSHNLQYEGAMSGFQHQNKAAAYNHLESAFRGLLTGSPLPYEAALTSLIALTKEQYPNISWVGFYRQPHVC